jgi:NAD(P)-dependent dehydrogenase (short-subunit alcohol dehydrogenase family)
MTSPLAIVAGVDPGLGAALARRFAVGGFRVAMIARDSGRMEALAAEIAASGGAAAAVSTDLSDHAAVREAMARILADHGVPGVLIWNAAVRAEAPALSLEPEALDRQLRLGMTGALSAIQAVAPAMEARGGGSILLTGGGLALAPAYGGAVPALTAVKSALRGFVHAAAPEFAAHGLRLGTVTVAGQIARGTAFDPDRIAEAFWTMHVSAAPDAEHLFDGS